MITCDICGRPVDRDQDEDENVLEPVLNLLDSTTTRCISDEERNIDTCDDCFESLCNSLNEVYKQWVIRGKHTSHLKLK